MIYNLGEGFTAFGGFQLRLIQDMTPPCAKYLEGARASMRAISKLCIRVEEGLRWAEDVLKPMAPFRQVQSSE